ncbi:MAG: hypothetical protein K8U57_31265 [Planctomycetes bacterium]|nr:hypothetical protein [Planctomycetota bacterium]
MNLRQARNSTVLLLILLSAGCGTETTQPTFADLHSVTGVVKWGGRPANGGSIQFNPDPTTLEFSTNSEVGADGTYSLTTVRTTDKSGERKSGAPAGKYKVTYTPPLTAQTAGGQPVFVELPTPVTVNAGTNDIPIELGKK